MDKSVSDKADLFLQPSGTQTGESVSNRAICKSKTKIAHFLKFKNNSAT